MTASLIQFLVAAAVIVTAGVTLTQFADTIAHQSKLGRLFVGTILLASATSLPELSIDISAVRLGSIDLAVGDLMGSSLFNLLILAVLDLTHHSRGRMLSKASAAHASAASVSIVITTIAAIFIYLGPKLESVAIAGIGPGSLALLAAYIAGVRLIYHGQKASQPKSENTERAASFLGLHKLKLKGAVTGYLGSGVIIVIAAPFLARAADDLAAQTGLGGTFFGTMFVALCTSLPEMVTTFTAVRMKAFDLALGNIFGSNCMNMALLVPLDFFHKTPLLAAVSPTHVYTALCMVVVTAVIILGQIHGVEKKRPFLEPDALLAITLIIAALAGVYFLR